LSIRRQEGPALEPEQEPTIQLSIPAAFRYLNIVGEAIRALLERTVEADKESGLINSVELAVHETCTNIVRHAYGNEGGRIEVALTLVGDPLQVVVDTYDSGRAFDVVEVREPDLDAVQDSGYGLFLVRSLMDDVSYHASDDGNRWHLVKRLE
jgi:serine/threonine-protein kinase RsbW